LDEALDYFLKSKQKLKFVNLFTSPTLTGQRTGGRNYVNKPKNIDTKDKKVC